jgi:hypothetical protein
MQAAQFLLSRGCLESMPGVKRRTVGKSGATVHLHAPLLLCGVVLNGARGFACTKFVLQSVLTGSPLGTAAPCIHSPPLSLEMLVSIALILDSPAIHFIYPYFLIYLSSHTAANSYSIPFFYLLYMTSYPDYSSCTDEQLLHPFPLCLPLHIIASCFITLLITLSLS